jgi:hypothetical protein
MISREKYLGIKWELIYKEMVFENHWAMLRFPRWNYSQQMGNDIKWILVIDRKCML